MVQIHGFPNNRIPVGQIYLHSTFNLEVPSPYTHSYIIPRSRRTEVNDSHTIEYYPLQYSTDRTPLGNLRFALRYEPLDLNVVIANLRKIGGVEIENWVLAEPTGGYSRRAWFLYETFLGETLNVEDPSSGNYVDVLDSKFHFVSKSFNSKRHRIHNNLTGNAQLCPIIRKTRRLEQMISLNLSEDAKSVTADYSSLNVMRAVSFFVYPRDTYNLCN